MNVQVKILSNDDYNSLAFDVRSYINENSKPEDVVDIKYSTVFDSLKNQIIYSALVYIEHK